MMLKTKDVDDLRAVFLEGRMDVHRSLEAETELDQMVAAGVVKIVFDLSQLEFLSSSGLRVFLGLLKKLRERKGRMALCCVPDVVMKVIRSSELETLFNVQDDMERALASIRDPDNPP